MIDRRDILEAASSFSLLSNVVEKDYNVLGWILAGINGLGEIAYRGPVSPTSGGWPKVKLDLTADERVRK